MIEPIGSGDDRLSPYDRYSQYRQYRGTANPAKSGDLWDPGAAQGKAVVPGQITPPGQSGAPYQSGFPGQSVPQDQDAQEPGVFKKDATRKPDAASNPVAVGKRECQTCKSRRYQDESNDSGVSYQTPTKISPDRAAAAVRSHENEHVTREQAKAKREGREVVSQSVVIKTAICPECGRVYISGGSTTTVTKAAKDKDSAFQPAQPSEADGAYLNKNV